MSSPPKPGSGIPKVLTRACQQCRGRKIRCDIAKPVCGACRSNNRECIYIYEAPKRRPSKALIETLQAQRKALEEVLISLKTADPAQISTLLDSVTVNGDSVQIPGLLPSPPSNNGGTGDVPDRSPVQTSKLGNNEDAGDLSSDEDLDPAAFLSVNEAGQIGAFGPTSALHDPLQAGELGRPEPTDQFRYQLIANATIQRQQEYRLRQLPDIDGVPTELAMHLLDLHWNRQHHSFLLTYRPAFTRDLLNGGPYCSKFLLNAVFACSSKFSQRIEVRDDPNDPTSSGKRFFDRCDDLISRENLLNASSIPTAIGLLLLGSTWVARSATSRGWLYTGYALRMVYDLGLHLDCKEIGGNAEDIEIRRRVFWGAFICDKVQSLYLGRPITIQLRDAHVSRDFFDTMEELELWTPYFDPMNPESHARSYGFTPMPTYSVSTFQQLCLLSKIMTKIINRFYVVGASAERARFTLQTVDDSLTSWYKNLPSHLLFEPWSDTASPTGVPHQATPNIIILMTTYHSLVILLHRPFISNGHLRSTTSGSSWRRCTAAARNITSLVQAYRATFSLRGAPYLLSYATYVACTIHTRNAAAGENSRGNEANPPIFETLDCLDEMSIPNPGVSNPANIIRKLMASNGIAQMSKAAFHAPTPSSFDLDAILQMFPASPIVTGQATQQNLDTYAPDLLFGFMESSFGSPTPFSNMPNGSLDHPSDTHIDSNSETMPSARRA